MKRITTEDTGRFTNFGEIDPNDTPYGDRGRSALVFTAQGEAWVPTSVCRLANLGFLKYTLLLPTWFCEQQGLTPAGRAWV